MDAADRAELADEIQTARQEGRRARDRGKKPEDCPYEDDQLQTAWLEGWREQDRNVQAL